MTHKLNGKDLANAFADSVNNFNFDNEEFATHFARQHRTLQQSMMRAMLTCIELAASEDYHTDGRNDATKKVCKQLIGGYRSELADQAASFTTSSWEDCVKQTKDYLPSKDLGFV